MLNTTNQKGVVTTKSLQGDKKNLTASLLDLVGKGNTLNVLQVLISLLPIFRREIMEDCKMKHRTEEAKGTKNVPAPPSLSAS